MSPPNIRLSCSIFSWSMLAALLSSSMPLWTEKWFSYKRRLECTSCVPFYQTKSSVMTVLGCNGLRCVTKILLSLTLCLSYNKQTYKSTCTCTLSCTNARWRNRDKSCLKLHAGMQQHPSTDLHKRLKTKNQQAFVVVVVKSIHTRSVDISPLFSHRFSRSQ